MCNQLCSLELRVGRSQLADGLNRLLVWMAQHTPEPWTTPDSGPANMTYCHCHNSLSKTSVSCLFANSYHANGVQVPRDKPFQRSRRTFL